RCRGHDTAAGVGGDVASSAERAGCRGNRHARSPGDVAERTHPRTSLTVEWIDDSLTPLQALPQSRERSHMFGCPPNSHGGGGRMTLVYHLIPSACIVGFTGLPCVVERVTDGFIGRSTHRSGLSARSQPQGGGGAMSSTLHRRWTVPVA